MLKLRFASLTFESIGMLFSHFVTLPTPKLQYLFLFRFRGLPNSVCVCICIPADDDEEAIRDTYYDFFYS